MMTRRLLVSLPPRVSMNPAPQTDRPDWPTLPRAMNRRRVWSEGSGWPFGVAPDSFYQAPTVPPKSRT
jgi:hypothetical protein